MADPLLSQPCADGDNPSFWRKNAGRYLVEDLKHVRKGCGCLRKVWYKLLQAPAFALNQH